MCGPPLTKEESDLAKEAKTAAKGLLAFSAVFGGITAFTCGIKSIAYGHFEPSFVGDGFKLADTLCFESPISAVVAGGVVGFLGLCLGKAADTVLHGRAALKSHEQNILRTPMRDIPAQHKAATLGTRILGYSTAGIVFLTSAACAVEQAASEDTPFTDTVKSILHMPAKETGATLEGVQQQTFAGLAP